MVESARCSSKRAEISIFLQNFFKNVDFFQKIRGKVRFRQNIFKILAIIGRNKATLETKIPQNRGRVCLGWRIQTFKMDEGCTDVFNILMSFFFSHFLYISYQKILKLSRNYGSMVKIFLTFIYILKIITYISNEKTGSFARRSRRK